MNPLVGRTLKAVAGLIVLGVIVSVVAGWWGEYQRNAALRAPVGRETSSTAPASSTAAPDAQQGSQATKSKSTSKHKPAETSPADAAKPQSDIVVIQIDGLNFRPKPDAGSSPIRGLPKGERLILLQARDGWYQVRASDGTEGWISANKGYTSIEKR